MRLLIALHENLLVCISDSFRHFTFVRAAPLRLSVRLRYIESRRIEKLDYRIVQRLAINIRALASMALFCAGVWLVPSGIALHFASHDGATKWSHLFMTIHNAASFLFLIAAVIHVIINWKVLTHYVNAKVGECMRFKRELWIAVLGVSVFVMLVASHALSIP